MSPTIETITNDYSYNRFVIEFTIEVAEKYIVTEDKLLRDEKAAFDAQNALMRFLSAPGHILFQHKHATCRKEWGKDIKIATASHLLLVKDSVHSAVTVAVADGITPPLPQDLAIFEQKLARASKDMQQLNSQLRYAEMGLALSGVNNLVLRMVHLNNATDAARNAQKIAIEITRDLSALIKTAPEASDILPLPEWLKTVDKVAKTDLKLPWPTIGFGSPADFSRVKNIFITFGRQLDMMHSMTAGAGTTIEQESFASLAKNHANYQKLATAIAVTLP